MRSSTGWPFHVEIPVDRLLHMMFAYPTFHRAVEDALADLGHGD
ncbi:hypothetical protein [Streptomyces wuyuanensis]